ncbi:MAG: hypothetical protein H6727_20540 [Myxococcales bacterium]|nr:hypothetical protein [Myxococcales bacterium]
MKTAKAENILKALEAGGQKSLAHLKDIPADKMAAYLKHLKEQGDLLGTAGVALGILAGLKDGIEAFQKGDYGDALGIVYKTAMGVFLSQNRVNWPGIINNMKGLVSSIFPQLQGHPIWDVLTTLDPLELGAKGIDAAVTLLRQFFNPDPKSLSKLVERFKKSGFSLLVKAGEMLGDKLHELLNKKEDTPKKMTEEQAFRQAFDAMPRQAGRLGR